MFIDCDETTYQAILEATERSVQKETKPVAISYEDLMTRASIAFVSCSALIAVVYTVFKVFGVY